MSLWRVAWRDLTQHGRLLFLLSLGLAVLAFAMASEFPDFRARMLAIGQHLPPIARRMFAARNGGSLQFENFAAVAYIHPVALMMMAAWPVARGAGAVAGEIDRGTLGWHLAYPIGRLSFLWGKALVMLGGVAFLQLVLFLGFQISVWWLGLENAGPVPYAHVALVGTLLYAAVGALTLWASAAANRAATAGTLGSAVIVVSLLLENVGGAYPLFEQYRWLSLYHYFDYRGLMSGHALATHDLAVLAGVALVGLVGATLQFARRDLQI
jgi:ABC-type transport system involved in multi-copper enzyme maturation permease subunit